MNTTSITFKTRVQQSLIYGIWCAIREIVAWRGWEYAAPGPHFIKRAVLLRNGFSNATWIETGTFLGQTTQFLSKFACHVHSIEPEPQLYANAVDRFKDHKNVSIICGESQTVLPVLLPEITGDVNFWLDGHYSAGVTFKGTQETPIVEELEIIGQHIAKFDAICVLVDDVRCFNPTLSEHNGYPALDNLVDWARKHDLSWHIEHDIFIAKSAGPVSEEPDP